MIRFVTFFAPAEGREIPAPLAHMVTLLRRSIAATNPGAEFLLLVPKGIRVNNPYGIDAKHLSARPRGLMTQKVQSWLDACTRLSPADTVLIDPDTLVVGRIDDPFEAPDYDIGLSWHPDRSLPHPLNAGVLFVPAASFDKAASFFDACMGEIGRLEPKYRDWYGDQQAMVNLCGADRIAGPTLPDAISVDEERVRFFDWSVWNRWPANEHDMTALDDGRARILHFKGPRKGLIEPYFASSFGT